MKRLFIIIVSALMLYSCGMFKSAPAQYENISLLQNDRLILTYADGEISIPLKNSIPYYEYKFNINANIDTLYSICRIVFPDIFNSAEDVIQTEDATLHTIIGKGISTDVVEFEVPKDRYNMYQSPHRYAIKMAYTIKIRCYNNLVKLDVYNQIAKGGVYSDSDDNIVEMVKYGIKNGTAVDNNYSGAGLVAIDNTAKELADIFWSKISSTLKEIRED